MENATKALLIAAGVFFAIMILSLLVTMYTQISSHYQQEQNLIEIEQLEKFNKEFENYNRDGLRGNELISFMNKIIDYNASQAYDEEIGYEKILVDINIGIDNLEQFKFEIKQGDIKDFYGNRNEFIIENITNTTASGDKYANDRKLVAITGTPTRLIEQAAAEPEGLSITDTQLQQLQSKISNIIIDENSTEDRDISNRYYRAQILKNILGWDIKEKVDENWICDSSISNRMELIKDITNRYYQYTQFKRALFDCTEVIYDTETKRIVEMNFEVQTKVEGGKRMVIFD